jgi:putative AdoMet-dependent methyltransferase
MEDIARQKVTHIAKRTFIKADILEVFPFEEGSFDSVISTYAIHHLTPDEKHALFREVARCLSNGGRAVFGDLMVQNEVERHAKLDSYLAKGDELTAKAIKEEFFWVIDVAVQDLRSFGFQVGMKRFSDLSYAIAAKRTQ